MTKKFSRTLAIMLALCLHCPPLFAGQDGNLLENLLPVRIQEVGNAGLLTDGIAAGEGADWTHPLATRFNSTFAYAEYDLGTMRHLGCIWLQGDNNDEYVVQASPDGLSYQPLWTAPAMRDSG